LQQPYQESDKGATSGFRVAVGGRRVGRIRGVLLGGQPWRPAAGYAGGRRARGARSFL